MNPTWTRRKIKIIPEGVEFEKNLMFAKSKKDEKVVLYHVLCATLCSFCGKKFRRCSKMTVQDVLYGNVVVRTFDAKLAKNRTWPKASFMPKCTYFICLSPYCCWSFFACNLFSFLSWFFVYELLNKTNKHENNKHLMDRHGRHYGQSAP